MADLLASTFHMKIVKEAENLFRLTRFGIINCFLVREPDGFSLVDTGLSGTAEMILRSADHLGGTIRRIVLTHMPIWIMLVRLMHWQRNCPTWNWRPASGRCVFLQEISHWMMGKTENRWLDSPERQHAQLGCSLTGTALDPCKPWHLRAIRPGISRTSTFEIIHCSSATHSRHKPVWPSLGYSNHCSPCLPYFPGMPCWLCKALQNFRGSILRVLPLAMAAPYFYQ